ncbi:hypothetical protein TKK_0003033 [Trichogramma kaykai]
MEEIVINAAKELEVITGRIKEVITNIENNYEEFKDKCQKEADVMNEKIKKLEIQLEGKMLYFDKLMRENVEEPKNNQVNHLNNMQAGCCYRGENCLANQGNHYCSGPNNCNSGYRNPGWVRGSRACPYYRPYNAKYQRY